MSRASSGDTIYTKPTNNIYTALAGIALLAQIIGLVIIFIKAKALFETGLF